MGASGAGLYAPLSVFRENDSVNRNHGENQEAML